MHYRLAARLGYANVDAMLAEMSLRHVREWVAFYDLEPPMEQRLGWLFASLEAKLLTIHRNVKKRRKGFEPSELYRYFGDERAATGAPQTPEQKREHLKTVTKMMKAQKAERERKAQERMARSAVRRANRALTKRGR